MDQEELRRHLESQIKPLRLEKLELSSLDKGYCTLEVDVSEEQMNYLGIVHGGIIFAIMDSAAGISCSTLAEKSVTLSASINFIKSIKKGRIRALAETVHSGRSTAVIRVKAFDESDQIIADANFTMYHIR